ncbi:protein FAR1-RELATED SEQUENCE 1-like [Lolium perenne]|uniref:protein FAR1-RELATED SEQUENCE 1-like n=1 Tax=Lolium perenne TaxID=4522 RepID=UPI003A99622E
MKKTIQTVLKSTTHRNCYFHIVTMMSQKESTFFAKNTGMSELLMYIAKNAFTPAEFEMGWNKEGARAQITCGNAIASTQTQMFLEQYEVIQDKCLSALDKKKLISSLKIAKTVTRHPFEKQALEQFTHDIFEKFQIKITNNTTFKVDGSLEPGRHLRLKRIVKFYDHMEFKRECFDVTFDDEKKNFMCSCKKMQRDGIHCCHVIKAMVHMEINDLPESFVI